MSEEMKMVLGYATGVILGSTCGAAIKLLPLPMVVKLPLAAATGWCIGVGAYYTFTEMI